MLGLLLEYIFSNREASIGGGGGIRTHKSSRTPVFKTGGIAVIRPLPYK